MSATFKPDHAGVGQMLRSDFMEAAMVRHAEVIRARAVAIAPVARKGQHQGRYKASFNIRHSRRGGATFDRAEAIVYNDSPESISVEFGHWGQEPYRTLAQAAFQRM